MNIEYNYTEIENVLTQYYLLRNIEQRNEARNLLNNSNFDELRCNYTHFYNKNEHSKILENSLISEVIIELQNFVTPNNCDKPTLTYLVNDEDAYRDGAIDIIISWCSYEVIDLLRCESMAKNSAKYITSKIEKQPNSKDAIKGLELFNKLR